LPTHSVPSSARHRGRLLTLIAAVVAALALLPAAAQADNPNQLTVVGTSDVSDSGLIPNLIQPEFENQYPQFTFKYVGSATGAAIKSAEGTGTTSGASALIVHAATLENTFVSQGFSDNNQYGNAIFTNDFVLLGPTASPDPAGVSANAGHNVAQAMADIAAAGAAGNATWESRGGGATASGTTVEEHKLWALMSTSGLTPSGVVVCVVSSTDGGGMTPISPSTQATSGMDCPDSGTVDGSNSDLPTWYQINAMSSQAANVIDANSCSTAPSGANTCYTLTDRGTYDYLASGTNTAGPNEVPNLAIVTRQNDAGAPGGPFELTNYFHIYIINPSAPGETPNVTAAKDFVTFLTSQGFQSQLANYLKDTTDQAGAPFVADASPTFTNMTSPFPASVVAGKTVTVAGTLQNAEPGYPALAGQTVSVDEIVGGVPITIKSGTTDTNGNFSISFVPASSGSYQLSTGQISMVEMPNLTPVYSDILSPAASTPVTISVGAFASISSAKGTSGGAAVTGTVGPAAPDANARVSILARRQGSSASFAEVGSDTLAAAQTKFAVNASLGAGKWQVEATYSDPGEISAGTSSAANVTVPTASTSVSFKKSKAKKGSLTVTGALSQPAGAGASVQLFALRRAALGKSHKSVRKTIAVGHAASVSFSRVGKVSVRAGKTTFTIKAKLKRRFRWVLQLKFIQSGRSSSFSKLATVNVN
jgi:ABC-type tungstate transport system permease subunit